MDHLEPDLRKVNMKAFAKRAGLINRLVLQTRHRPTGCPAKCPVGRRTTPESSGFTCFSEAVRTFTGITVGSLVFDFSLPGSRCVWERRSTAFHTLFFQVALV